MLRHVLRAAALLLFSFSELPVVLVGLGLLLFARVAPCAVARPGRIRVNNRPVRGELKDIKIFLKRHVGGAF